MSLYGSLFAGVGGLFAQSMKLAVISDNVANVNTVGYKGSNALFETLVTGSGSTSSYSPGGVIGGSRQAVSTQGLLTTTDSATDIAISGQGLFVVNQNSAGTGQVFYTRSGSFRADSLGNYRNGSGFYLFAWALDRDGRLPGEAGNVTNTVSSANLSSLEVVNIGSLTGSAAATTSVSIGANLNAAQTVFPGAAGTITMDALNVDNYGIAAKDIIVPSAVNSLSRGDKMLITTGNGLDITYRYGGFTHSRDIGDATDADSGLSLLSGSTLLGTNPFALTSGSNVITVTHTSHGLATGGVVSLSGNANDISGISSSSFSGSFVVTVVDDDTYTIETANAADETTLAAAPLAVTNGSATVTVTHAAHGLSVGQSITIAGAAAVGGITPNGTFTVASVVDANSYTYTFTSNATSTTSGGGAAVTEFANDGGGATITSVTRPFAGSILDATNNTTRFLAITGVSGYTEAGLTFTITTPAIGTATFTYKSSSPDVRQKQFNNLTNLAASINEVSGLSARVVDGQLFVGATDANAAVTFANGSTLGIDGPPVQAGIDWVRELGLSNISSGENRFSSMEGLYNLATTEAGISASLENPLGEAVLSINVDDPLDTIHFEDIPTVSSLTAFTTATPVTTTSGSSVVVIDHPAHGFQNGDFITLDTSAWAATVDGYNGLDESELNGRFEITYLDSGQYSIDLGSSAIATSSGVTGDVGLVVTPHNNLGSLVAELGLVDSLNGAVYTPQETSDLGPAYDPGDTALNMASGNISAQFSRPIRIYDAQGGGHDLSIAFLKTDTNTWSIEVFAVPDSDVISSLPDGLVAFGNISFNGDGTLRSIDSSLSQDIDVTWTNGAASSVLAFDFGTAGQPFGTAGATTFGQADGLSQFNAAYKVAFATQNGAPVGELTGVSITEDGVIVTSYSNGQTQNLFKIPVASFANPDQLASSSGNVFSQTTDSGEFNLQEAGTGGVGKIAASSLEASNVELSNELTNMIVAQRSYQANAKVISTADNMLEELNRIIT